MFFCDCHIGSSCHCRSAWKSSSTSPRRNGVYSRIWALRHTIYPVRKSHRCLQSSGNTYWPFSKRLFRIGDRYLPEERDPADRRRKPPKGGNRAQCACAWGALDHRRIARGRRLRTRSDDFGLGALAGGPRCVPTPNPKSKNRLRNLREL